MSRFSEQKQLGHRLWDVQHRMLTGSVGSQASPPGPINRVCPVLDAVIWMDFMPGNARPLWFNGFGSVTTWIVEGVCPTQTT